MIAQDNPLFIFPDTTSSMENNTIANISKAYQQFAHYQDSNLIFHLFTKT